MSVNRYQPHVVILPEDLANFKIAVGFLKGVTAARSMHILPYSGGWHKVLDELEKVHIFSMRQYPKRFMILLIDFDLDPSRLNYVRGRIPDDLADRVFILGVYSEPEALSAALSNSGYHQIGNRLAEECAANLYPTWQHELLRHNSEELNRLRQGVRPFLFP